MAGTVEQKLNELGIVLHQPNPPIANYVGFVRTGNLLFVSGQVCFDAQGKLIAKGKLGAGVTVEQGNAAARGCGINLLAQIKAAIGDLDAPRRTVDADPHLHLAAARRRLLRVLHEPAQRLRDGAEGDLQHAAARALVDHHPDVVALGESVQGRVDELLDPHRQRRLARRLPGVGGHLREDLAAALDLLADEARVERDVAEQERP